MLLRAAVDCRRHRAHGGLTCGTARAWWLAALPAVAALLLMPPAAPAVSLLPRSVVAVTAAKPTAKAAALRRRVTIGIGDQKADMFRDPRFTALGVKHARLAVSWDAMKRFWETEQIDQWLGLAKAAEVEPLISIGHSRTNRRSLPTPVQLRGSFAAFASATRGSTTFATWNEANHCGEPTCHRPKLVAAYYRALRRECPNCTILAPGAAGHAQHGRLGALVSHAPRLDAEGCGACTTTSRPTAFR